MKTVVTFLLTLAVWPLFAQTPPDTLADRYLKTRPAQVDRFLLPYLRSIYIDAHESGRSHGYQSGLATGDSVGYQRGWSTGNADGLSIGYRIGKAVGDSIGFQRGFAAGLAWAKPTDPPIPEKPVYSKLIGTDWVPGLDPDELKRNPSMAFVFYNEPNRPYYAAGKFAGFDADGTSPSGRSERDNITKYARYARQSGLILLVSPILQLSDRFNPDGSIKPMPTNWVGMKQRTRDVKASLHPYLSIKTSWTDANKRFWNESYNQKKSTNASQNAETDGQVVPTLVCIFDSTAGSPKFIIDQLIDQTVDELASELCDGICTGLTIVPSGQTDELRSDIQQKPAVDLDGGWMTDANPRNVAVFQNWLRATFDNNINRFNAFIQTAVHPGGTLVAVKTTYKDFSEVKFSWNAGRKNYVTWLDLVSDTYHALMMRKFMRYCYGRMASRMRLIGVEEDRINKFGFTYDYGQPVLGPQSPATRQLFAFLIADTSGVIQENIGPNVRGERAGALLTGFSSGRTWVNSDASFWRTGIRNRAAGWGIFPLDQYLQAWQSGIQTLGFRMLFDNDGDSPSVEQYLGDFFARIAAGDFVRKLKPTTYSEESITVNLLDLYKDRGAGADLTTIWSKRTGDANEKKAIRFRVVDNLTSQLPKLVEPGQN